VLCGLELDPPLFEDASPTRQREWQLALSDLNGVSPIPGVATARAENEPVLTLGRPQNGGISIQIEMPAAESRHVKLSDHRWCRHFRAYHKVIEGLVRSTSAFSGTDELADLDYAK
jgi:hypothetical protein